MTYRELLNLYKQGKLDDVRKKEVEASIEKQDAISEFLYEEGEILEFSDLESENAENPENEEWLSGQKNNQKDEINRQFIKEIRWSIRKAIIKMGIIIASAINNGFKIGDLNFWFNQTPILYATMLNVRPNNPSLTILFMMFLTSFCYNFLL